MYASAISGFIIVFFDRRQIFISRLADDVHRGRFPSVIWAFLWLWAG